MPESQRGTANRDSKVRPTSYFNRLNEAIENRVLYPFNTIALLGQDPTQMQIPIPASFLAAMEPRVEATVRELRNRLTYQEAKKIVVSILPTLEPTDVSSTHWIAEPSSRLLRPQEVITSLGPHSVFLDQALQSDDFFQKLVCAMLLKSTQPKLSFLQVIVMALMAYGDIADETEICDWMWENIPFCGQCIKARLALVIHRELTVVFESRHRVLEPIDAAVCGRGLVYEREQKGRVWRLPTNSENRIFQGLYAPGHVLLWNRPRPFVATQNMPRIRSVAAINGTPFLAHSYVPKLEMMPAEILDQIAWHSVLRSETVQALITSAGIGFYQIAAESITANATGQFANLPRRRHYRELGLIDARPLCGLPRLDELIREQFFSNNHFRLKDSVHGYHATTYQMSASGVANDVTYLPWEFVDRLGSKSAELLTSISIELQVEALEETEVFHFDEGYAEKVIEFLSLVRESSNLRCLEVHIEWVRAEDVRGLYMGGDVPDLKVFEELSAFRGLREVYLPGLELFPALREELVRLMTSPQ
ncbi:uncharacterized protein N0V89_003361 [Didymosphaeria variabile]|uniref:Uncharacterized protein n=1 Tax=Didymosphaeria variabile TaxID=1932322 RepID=A0A9W9CFA1_9PLEO|nr:uncharacterized protein N0V89_003361 [Didymosphaeria variabile]KAJ4358777.1 hypothetical protein N0V89_003361 [Didymosphaeria variabile]